ncbi:MAG TPA: FG-GAP-like repeat-containing protein [Terriglobia bacterium]|nr:FG-GAP-like repeat-containing protein [Terriglobia bacterium]
MGSWLRRIWRLHLSRRQFLSWCGYALAAPVAAGFPRRGVDRALLPEAPQPSHPQSDYFVPHYRSTPPLDEILKKVDPAKDVFPTETLALEINKVLEKWRAALVEGNSSAGEIGRCFSPRFKGGSLRGAERLLPRSDSNLKIWKRNFNGASAALDAPAFLRELQNYLGSGKFTCVEFKIVGVSAPSTSTAPTHSPGHSGAKNASEGAGRLPQAIHTRVRYDLVDAGPGYYREQRAGIWNLEWERGSSDTLQLTGWQPTVETCGRAFAPAFQDVTEEALGSNASYHEQLLRGTDYWRTVLDGACGIDIYGNQGVAVGDIDNDGFDEIYVCQPSGLPNRLYRNRGDGTFEDITRYAGVGVLDSSPFALFADINNDGFEDLIVVCGTAPLLFLNQGNGKFRLQEKAFQFAQPAQGTFTGAALADYDRDGWLDVYFCLYSYYQGPDRYRYPVPYFNARNGPPNFLFRNNRDGTFTDVTHTAKLDENNHRFSFACGWTDYNQDGWPDLYVANDFGQKNLYRNNGDGTFTDVAQESGVLDTGAGMSVCWLDYDNDGQQDLYVADMWTAAGLRVTDLENFMPDAPSSVRALYRKHAMGNSLFRNQGQGAFKNQTSEADVGIGRWAWSSDAWDFDHDGYPDLYIANGMISGPKAHDLSSFFWRQVVARSPQGSAPTEEYEQGWNAINELIRSGGTWSGYERNVFYANNRDGTFSDVSGALGLDFIDDSRSFALTDIDHDGRLEVILKNRTGPQVRILRNAMPHLGESIAFRLRGHTSNRDAVGASVTITRARGQQTKFLQAGSGFLSQHTKELFFGLGDSGEPVQVTVRWPNGQVQHLADAPAGHRIEIEEGVEHFKAAPFAVVALEARPGGVRRSLHSTQLTSGSSRKPQDSQLSSSLPADFATWLIAPLAPPGFSLPDLAGRVHTLASYRGKPALLNFWETQTPACSEQLRDFQTHYDRWQIRGVHLLALNLDAPTRATKVREFSDRLGLRFPVLLATPDVAAIYNLLYRYLFDRRRDLTIPTSFVLDASGMIVRIYQGRFDPAELLEDVRRFPRTPSERQALALPFPGKFYGGSFARNYFTYGVAFARHGYAAAAESAFLRAIHEEPDSADAYYDLGTLYMQQRKWDLADEQLRQAVKLKPDDLLGLNNLGVIAAQQGRTDEAAAWFTKGLQADSRNTLALQNLADLDRTQGKYAAAQALLERALSIEPHNPELNYKLGMVFADARQNGRAKEYLEKAVALRPDYAEALNNLGVLYLMMGDSARARAEFLESIQRAPKFDQAYLNLARVDIRLGKTQAARSVLQKLLEEIPNHPLARKYLEKLDRRAGGRD